MTKIPFCFLSALGMTALVACSETHPAPAQQSCDELQAPPSLLACAQPVSGWSEAGTATERSLSFSGTVTAIADGPASGGCFNEMMWNSNQAVVALTVHGTVDGTEGDYYVGYSVPDNSVEWSPGDAVSVQYSSHVWGWMTQVVSLTLSHGQAVDVYLGLGASVEDFSKAPFTFEAGDSICTQTETCGSWAAYDYDVVRNDGRVSVAYGTTVGIDGYHVIHGGAVKQLSATNQCADWSMFSARVAVLRDGT